MLTAVLAGSGGSVVLPDAVAVEPGNNDDEVKFVDHNGRTLTIFSRKDLVAYTGDGRVVQLAQDAELKERAG